MKAIPISNSYGQILKSTSITGGAQAISLLLGMARTKLVALLLGPSGVGLIGLYESAIALVGGVTGLGIGASGVRQVAESYGSSNAESVGHTVHVLRRVCWITGLLGVVVTAVLAYPLSLWTFGNFECAVPLALLGITLLPTALSEGQSALLCGVRRIGDVARIQVLHSIAGLVIGVGLYAWLGERGIVPVLVLISSLKLAFTWWFSRRVQVLWVDLDWRTTFRHAGRLIQLGAAFMLSGLVVNAVSLITRSWVLRDYGIQANGFYQAAFAISGVFAGFVLQAMGLDFYPRLTAVARDNAEVNRLVNEQTEIGTLLALPALLATLAFSPWIIKLLYSAAFLDAAPLLCWFTLGTFLRVVFWPVGYIVLAKGAAGWFAATQVLFTVLHIVLIWTCLRWLGLVGVALAFALAYVGYGMGMCCLAKYLCCFHFTAAVTRLLLETVSLVVGVFLLVCLAPQPFASVLGGGIAAVCGLFCVRQICQRLGPEHRVSRSVAWIPGVVP